jgi:hypothetical protein
MKSSITKQFITNNLLQKNGVLNAKSTQKIIDEYSISYAELYLIYNELDDVLCPVCGNRSKFISFKKGFQTTCSIKCSNAHTEYNDKRVTTKKEIYGESYEDIHTKIKETSYKKYGVSSPNQSDIVKQYKVKVSQLKYGVDNPAQAQEIINKIHDTKILRYGTTSYNNRKQFRQTMMSKYGVEHGRHIHIQNIEELLSLTIDDFQKFIINGYIDKEMFCDFYNVSYNTFYDMITKLDLKHVPIKFYANKEQAKIYDFVSKFTHAKFNDRILLDGKELDILTNTLAIEYNGLMFHSFGISEHEKFNTAHDENDRKHYHLNKTVLSEENGIQLLHIFENEWRSDIQNNIWKSIIKSKLGVSNKRVYARNCVIKEISSEVAAEFINRTHLQQYAKSKIKLGLFHNDNLVSVMTFGKPRYNNMYEWELIRFCTELDTTVIGGGSKLLKYFERNFSPKSLLSYANRRWSNGNFYRTVGFDFIKNTSPNYFYFNENSTILLSREKFQKHKLLDILDNFNPDLSESQNMYINGYRKIYDAGNMVFVKYYS